MEIYRQYNALITVALLRLSLITLQLPAVNVIPINHYII